MPEEKKLEDLSFLLMEKSGKINKIYSKLKSNNYSEIYSSYKKNIQIQIFVIYQVQHH